MKISIIALDEARIRGIQCKSNFKNHIANVLPYFYYIHENKIEKI